MTATTTPNPCTSAAPTTAAGSLGSRVSTASSPSVATSTHPPYRGRERRHHPRRACRFNVVVHEVDQYGSVGPAHTCVCINISAGGIGFRSRRTYTKGARLLIVPSVASATPQVWHAAVRHTAYADQARYVVGVQFESDFADAAVTQWMTSRESNLV